MTKEKKGKFIVLYGINNLGKSTQRKKIVEKLISKNILTTHVKYAIYGLEPSGHLLQGYLREGNKWNLSAREFQIMQVLNRMQIEPTIKSYLRNGTSIVAEDYTGTGITWGMGAGIEEEFLEYINSHLLKEDLGILLEGKRFIDGVEKEHKHEQNDNLTEKVRKMHLYLAAKKDWKVVNANQNEEKVFQDIWKNIEKLF